MECLINTFENEEGETNVVSLVIRAIVLSIPNLVDIVLTILSFDKDNINLFYNKIHSPIFKHYILYFMWYFLFL